jgi:hypothetical protein
LYLAVGDTGVSLSNRNKLLSLSQERMLLNVPR